MQAAGKASALSGLVSAAMRGHVGDGVGSEGDHCPVLGFDRPGL
jgi:hypothetical protein